MRILRRKDRLKDRVGGNCRDIKRPANSRCSLLARSASTSGVTRLPTGSPFKIGIGPSSSHTAAPMKAASTFHSRLESRMSIGLRSYSLAHSHGPGRDLQRTRRSLLVYRKALDRLIRTRRTGFLNGFVRIAA